MRAVVSFEQARLEGKLLDWRGSDLWRRGSCTSQAIDFDTIPVDILHVGRAAAEVFYSLSTALNSGNDTAFKTELFDLLTFVRLMW